MFRNQKRNLLCIFEKLQLRRDKIDVAKFIKCEEAKSKGRVTSPGYPTASPARKT